MVLRGAERWVVRVSGSKCWMLESELEVTRRGTLRGTPVEHPRENPEASKVPEEA